MKKKIIIFGSIAAVLVVAGIIFTVALLKPNEQPPAGEDPTVELAVPRGVTLNGTVLSWDAVENATEYIVYVNDKEYTTNDCSFDLDGKANERDKIKVVAKAEGYLNSKFSIEKIYITVVDHKEVTSMATNLSNYISEIGYDDKTLEQIAPAIENVCVALFKEGLVAQDIENIVTTLDSVVNNLEELDVETPQELLEVVTTEVNKLVDLNIPSYALTVALKEVASFVVDITLEEVNVGKQNMCLVVGMPSYGMTQEEVIELLINLNDYLDNIKNRDLEKIAMVIDTFKNVYVALNKEIPTIVAELEKLYTTTNGEASFEAVYSVLENLVKVKDSVLNAVLSSMPTMEEFTEVVSLFESLYENLAPEYLVENNPYDLYIYLWQEYYSNVHLLLSFYKEIDAEMLLELKPYITNIYKIFENEYNDFLNYMLENDEMSPLGLIQYILLQTGLTDEEINDLVFGIMSLIEDITETPEDFINKLLTDFYKVFEDFDYSIITEDPLVQKIMTIVLSEDPEAALKDFLENDLKIEKYISYKDGKTMDDLLTALMNVSLEEVINFLASGEEFTSTKVVEVLGIEDIVTLKVEDLFKALFKLADVETLELVNAVLRVENISDIETILAKYFNVNVNFEELLTNSLNSILAEYNLDLEYKGLIDNFIKNLSLDKLYTEFGNVYNVIVKNVTEFNTNYVPLVPTKDPASTEVLLDYMHKNMIYNIFGNESAAAVKDLKTIYESLIALKEHDEIKDVLDNVVQLFKNYDYSFDFEAYINDEAYLAAFNKKLTDLATNLLTETEKAYDWVLGFEEDLADIAKTLDDFASKYFGISLYANEYVNYLFEMLEMYAMNDEMKEIYQDTIKDFVENVLRVVLEDAYEFGGNAAKLVNNIYQTLDENILDIIELYKNFDKNIDIETYLIDNEYKEEVNQKLLDLCYDLIDQYVLLYDKALTTEEFFNEFAEYVDELCEDYFYDSLDLAWFIEDLFEELDYYQLSEEDVDLAKEYVAFVIIDCLPTIVSELYDVSDELYELVSEMINDVTTNANRIMELTVELTQAYVMYYNEASEMAKPGVLDEYIDYEKMQKKYAIQKLYVDKAAEINELCNLLETIFTIENEEILSVLDDAIENICTLFGVESEVNASSLMNDLIVIVELVKNLDEMIFDNPSILDKIPSIEIDDVIIPV